MSSSDLHMQFSVTERQLRVMLFALRNMSAEARALASQAYQDKSGKHFSAEDGPKFMNDARDAETIQVMIEHMLTEHVHLDSF